MRRRKTLAPAVRPLLMSDWLDLMLGEIDRRNREQAAARQELRRRQEEQSDTPSADDDSDQEK